PSMGGKMAASPSKVGTATKFSCAPGSKAARRPRPRPMRWRSKFESKPRRSDLSLQAHNGGISISEVAGKIEFKTMNGGVSLRRVGGAVSGNTTNGGVHVELAGARWEGEMLNVTTTNGGVNIALPDNYSAHLETATTNGNVSSDFALNVPLTDRGRMPKEIN